MSGVLRVKAVSIFSIGGVNLLRLWTIQTKEALSEFEEKGVLHGNSAFICKDFEPAYRWMSGQMKRRIKGLPPEGIGYPVWAWYQWRDSRHKKPDIRYSGHHIKGTEAVRIEFEAPEDQVLLSDFETFHYVLNYWYLPLNEQDDLEFDTLLEAIGVDIFDVQDIKKDSVELQKIRNRIEKSWDKVFDLDWDNDYSSHARTEKSIQAVLWEIKWNWVKRTEYFITR